MKFSEEVRPVVPTVQVPKKKWRKIRSNMRRRCSRAGGTWMEGEEECASGGGHAMGEIFIDRVFYELGFDQVL